MAIKPPGSFSPIRNDLIAGKAFFADARDPRHSKLFRAVDFLSEIFVGFVPYIRDQIVVICVKTPSPA